MTPGRAITFYSYKGGSGRSMALANVACLLAGQGHRVLAIDWDLEAPGLHQFFRGRLASGDDGLIEQPGLVDLLETSRDTINRLGLEERRDDESMDDVLRETRVGDFVLPTTIDGLFLVTAGRFDQHYPRRVREFNWENYFSSAPGLLPALIGQFGEAFDYVLIDSRTGVTDAGSICTAVLPERLVVVFTPARQSLEGGVAIAQNAVENRRNSSDLRPLQIYPLPSRIEMTEAELRAQWRFGAAGLAGYQGLFEGMFGRAYGLRVDLDSYFNEVQIPHVPRYAYGEEVAVLRERSGDRLGLAEAFRRFTEILISPGFIGAEDEPET